MESRWQDMWREAGIGDTPASSPGRPDIYVVVLTSGAGHLGDFRGCAIGDAYARFRRARGDAVLFAPGLDAPVAQRFGCAFDPDLVPASVDRAVLRAGRLTDYVEELDRRIEELDGWNKLAVASQRAALGRVDGVEVEVDGPDGRPLRVFSPHAERLARAAFVALPPDLPGLDGWFDDLPVRPGASRPAGTRRADYDAAAATVVDTGAQVVVPGLDRKLPLFVDPGADPSYGAVFGIPAAHAADAAVARRFCLDDTERGGESVARPAVRYTCRDIVLDGHELSWTVPDLARWLPVDVVVCGTEAPLLEARFAAKVLRDAGPLASLASGEPYDRVLMHETVQVDGRRAGANAPVELAAAVGADTLRLALLYAAAPRLKVVWNEQPRRICRDFVESLWGFTLERAERVAFDRLDGMAIETSEACRGRLAVWRDTAVERATAAYDRLDTHLVARDVMKLFGHLRQYDERARARHDVPDRVDDEALAIVLATVLALLAPLAPHVAEELWARCGGTGLLATTPWPEPLGT